MPHSIITKEILPDLKKNPSGYLKSHDMEIVRTPDDSEAVSPSSIKWNTVTEDNFPYILRQKPGEKNALGKVKFLFPNQYSIYMHDTPSKKYFNDTDRAFSHGCIRVAEPQKLAEFVLRDNKAWPSEKIDSVFKNTGEKEIQVKARKIPVTITYFTSWVDSKGNLNFRNDIYERDKNADGKLFDGKVEKLNQICHCEGGRFLFGFEYND
ncbi:MAG: L,D-transpeptidase family protein [Sphingobacteriales bacterium]|nr:L,D-transpeptidase family protein [Sphingobacteriales bacterium]